MTGGMDIQTFETIMIFRGDMDETRYDDKVDKWKDILNGLPGCRIHTERLGKKKLAYKIKDNTEGWYVLFTYQSTRDLVNSKLDLRLRQDDDVIKFLSMDTPEKEYEPDPDQQDEDGEQTGHSKRKPIDVFDLIFGI